MAQLLKLVASRNISILLPPIKNRVGIRDGADASRVELVEGLDAGYLRFGLKLFDGVKMWLGEHLILALRQEHLLLLVGCELVLLFHISYL